MIPHRGSSEEIKIALEKLDALSNSILQLLYFILLKIMKLLRQTNLARLYREQR